MQPKARRETLELRGGALRAAVTAPPEQGKANAAVIALLAATWRLPKSSLAVIGGAAARRKVVSATGDPQALAGRIGAWVDEHA